MTRDELLDLIPLFAAGALEPAEADALRARLATGDPELAAALAEAEATFTMLGRAVEPVAPPPAARNKLLATLGNRPADLPIRLHRRNPIIPILAGAVASIVVGIICWMASSTVASTPLKQQMVILEKDIEARDRELERREIRLRTLESLVQARNLEMYRLASELQPQAGGRVFVTPATGKWHVVFFDLHPPGEGKQYQLWFLTADSKAIPSTAFDVDKNGVATVIVTVPKDAGSITAAAITDEPTGGSPTPSGKIQLVGNLQ